VGEDAFILRIAWDIAFQIVFIYILLAIITGIVIDAFGALKEQKEADDDDLKSICFVCNIDRFTADQNGIGFDKHVKIEHSPKWYLFFLLYLQRKPKMNLSGQERYVKDLVWPQG
jgi:inositol 1,4,5-triphosphate receptor type 3